MLVSQNLVGLEYRFRPSKFVLLFGHILFSFYYWTNLDSLDFVISKSQQSWCFDCGATKTSGFISLPVYNMDWKSFLFKMYNWVALIMPSGLHKCIVICTVISFL